MLSLMGFGAIAAIATGFIPGVIFGLVIELILFVMAGLSLAWANKWEELPKIVLDVFDEHVKDEV